MRNNQTINMDAKNFKKKKMDETQNFVNLLSRMI